MNRVQVRAEIEERAEVAQGVYRMTLRCPEVASVIRAGQFVNIRVREDGWDPLLRRPFSVSRVDGDRMEVVFNIVGAGTRAMAGTGIGRTLDVLGPLGKPFSVDADYATALLVGGGLGVAPLPLLTDHLRKLGRRWKTFLGARSAGQLYQDHLSEVHVATDDGSAGLRGTVVDLLGSVLDGNAVERPMIFACGPTPMLKAVGAFARQRSIPCELSLEGDMACGIGLCQGCPVERLGGTKRYALVCTEGPTFRAEEVAL